MKNRWSTKYLLLWGLWVVAFFVLEGIGLIGGEDDGLPTLTEVITVFLPGFAVFMVLGWFFWHFIASYHDKKKLGDGD